MKGKLTLTITIGFTAFIFTMVMFTQFKTIEQTDITAIETMREAELRTELSKIKEKYADIQLNLVIPYLTSDINEYKELYYEKYDHILMADLPERTPKKFQILKCNEYMVNNSDFIICYVQYSWGGASKTLEYAQKKKHIKIFNLAQD